MHRAPEIGDYDGRSSPYPFSGLVTVIFILIGIGFLWVLDGEEPPAPSPTTIATTPTVRSTPTGYISRYGGEATVYSQIRVITDCDALQEQFDLAAGNNDRATPGTPAHKWTLGYMTASTTGCEISAAY